MCCYTNRRFDFANSHFLIIVHTDITTYRDFGEASKVFTKSSRCQQYPTRPGQARVPVTNKARTPVTNKGQSSPKPKATITGCAEQPSAGCAVGYSANARCLLSGQISARCLFRGVYSSLFQYIPIDKKLPFLAHFIKN